MIEDCFETGTKVIIPKYTQIQELLNHDIVWEPLNCLLFANERLGSDQYRSGFILVRKEAFKANGVVYDVAARRLKTEKSLMEHYSIPIVLSQKHSSESMFRIAFEMLCDAGKRRSMVWTPQSREPYLIDTYFDGKAINQSISPYLCLNVSDVVGKHPEGKKLERKIHNIVWYSRHAR